MKPTDDAPENPAQPDEKKKDKPSALRSVGNDATSYKGNHTSRVIGVPNWTPEE